MNDRIITFDGTTASCPIGKVTRITGTLNDIDVLPFGNEIMLLNGDVDRPPKRAEGELQVSGIQGTYAIKLDWLQADRVATAPLVAKNRPFAERLVVSYLDDGALSSTDLDLMTGASWGPTPDTAKTTSSGSSRLFANRCPAAVLSMNGFEAPDPSGWLLEQMRRCVHAYHVDDDGNLVPWLPADNPDWNLSQPYGAKIGGFRKGQGPQWNHTGWPTCDWKHFALQTTEIAACYGSRVAYLHSVMHWNAAVSGIGKEDHNGPRGIGHMLRAGSHLFALGYGKAVGGLALCLDVVDERFEMTGGFGWLSLGKPSGGAGHPGAKDPDVIATAALLGIPNDSEGKNPCAESMSSFELGILAVGIEAVHRFVVWDQSSRAQVLLDQFVLMSQPAWDHELGTVIAGAPFFEDLTPSSRLAPALTPVANIGHRTGERMSKSVLARFAETGVRALLQIFPEHPQLTQLAQASAALRGPLPALQACEVWYGGDS